MKLWAYMIRYSAPSSQTTGNKKSIESWSSYPNIYILRAFPNYFFLTGGVENLKARLARTYLRVAGNTSV